MQVVMDTRELLKRTCNCSMIKIPVALYRRLIEAADVPEDCADELLTAAKQWLDSGPDKSRVIVLRKQLEALLQAVGLKKPNEK